MDLIILDVLESPVAISPEPQAYELISKLKVTRAKANKLIYESELRRTKHLDLEARIKHCCASR